MTVRCSWATAPLLQEYHDNEWGVPQHDDDALFELLCLEGAQAGLSWEMILRKRQGYRSAFAGFNPGTVAGFDQQRIEALVADQGIVRHRGKIEAAVSNARAFRALQEEFGTFDRWLWAFVDNTPRRTERGPGEHPAAVSPLSERVSKDL